VKIEVKITLFMAKHDKKPYCKNFINKYVAKIIKIYAQIAQWCLF